MVSVIIPVYNAEAYVERCIRSVMQQTLRDLEIIVVDDQSSDGSLSIIKKLQEEDGRIKLINQGVNLGVSAARNAGLEKASGRYIQFIDSDDRLFPNACENLLKEIENQECDCVICGIQQDNGNVWAPDKHLLLKSNQQIRNTFGKLLQTELLSPCWNKIFKKHLIKDNFREGMNFGEDALFCLQYISQVQSISFIPDLLYRHNNIPHASLVHKLDIGRLGDIERYQCLVLDLVEDGLAVENNLKYVKDVFHCLSLLFHSTLPVSQISKIISEWLKTSHFLKLSVRDYDLLFHQKAMKWFMTHHMIWAYYYLVMLWG